MRKTATILLGLAACAASAQAQEASQADGAADLAKKWVHPVVALIGVPLQSNDGASKSGLNVQPVVPIWQ